MYYGRGIVLLILVIIYDRCIHGRGIVPRDISYYTTSYYGVEYCYYMKFSIHFRTTCTKEVVVNELVKLRNGIPTFNGYTKLHELVKVGIMYMVGDVPGIAKEQNRVQQNAKSSCGHCTDQGICSESFCSFFRLKPRYQT